MPELGLMKNTFDKIRCEDDTGEWWSARALMPLMGYMRWESFEEAITRARAGMRNSGFDPDEHASWRRETVPIRQNAGEQSRINYRLTRFGAYMLAMNGDPRKQEIAEAQSYFAIRTRQAEAMMLAEPERVDDHLAALELATQRTMQAITIAREERARRQQAEHVLGIAAPKADAWEQLAEANGDYAVREAANILNRDPAINTGQKKLFARLRDWRMVDRRDIPYQSHEKHLVLRLIRFTDGAGVARAESQVRVTVEGLRYLHKRLGGTTRFTDLLEQMTEPVAALPQQRVAEPQALFELESA